MFPTIHLFGLNVSTYWMMFAIGFIAMTVLLIVRRKRFALSTPKALIFSVMMAVFGLLGAKALYLIENIELVKRYGIKIGGMSFYGSVWMIMLFMPLVGLIFKLRPKKTLDAASPAVAIMIGFMRVGCFFNGCCGGITVRSATGSFTWPTQAIESVGDFIILFILLEWERRKETDGRLYPAFLALYGTLRFFVEFVRDTPKEVLGMSYGQLYSLASALLGAGYLIYRHIIYGKTIKGDNR